MKILIQSCYSNVHNNNKQRTLTIDHDLNPSLHYSDVIMTLMASQITSLTTVYSAVYSGTDQRKHQSSALLAFVRGIHRRPMNSPHKGPVTRKMFPVDDVIMITHTPPHTHNNSNNNKNEHGEHTLHSLVSNWVSVVCWSRVTTRPLCVQYSYGVIWNAVRLDERFAVQPVYTMTVHQVGCKLPCTKWCPHHVGEMVIHSYWYINESNSRQR